MKLKRYSPKAASTYLREFPAVGMFTKYWLGEDRVALDTLELLIKAECLKWADHIEKIIPSKKLLGEMIVKDRARFWDLQCSNQFICNTGYYQVTTGYTKPQLYAEWTVLGIIESMLGN